MDQHGYFAGNALAREYGSWGLPGVGPPGTSFALPFARLPPTGVVAPRTDSPTRS